MKFKNIVLGNIFLVWLLGSVSYAGGSVSRELNLETEGELVLGTVYCRVERMMHFNQLRVDPYHSYLNSVIPISRTLIAQLVQARVIDSFGSNPTFWLVEKGRTEDYEKLCREILAQTQQKVDQWTSKEYFYSLELIEDYQFVENYQ